MGEVAAAVGAADGEAEGAAVGATVVGDAFTVLLFFAAFFFLAGASLRGTFKLPRRRSSILPSVPTATAAVASKGRMKSVREIVCSILSCASLPVELYLEDV